MLRLPSHGLGTPGRALLDGTAPVACTGSRQRQLEKGGLGRTEWWGWSEVGGSRGRSGGCDTAVQSFMACSHSIALPFWQSNKEPKSRSLLVADSFAAAGEQWRDGQASGVAAGRRDLRGRAKPGYCRTKSS